MKDDRSIPPSVKSFENPSSTKVRNTSMSVKGRGQKRMSFPLEPDSIQLKVESSSRVTRLLRPRVAAASDRDKKALEYEG